MDKLQRTLEIRLGELRPVVDAIELTRGLRGKIVGGNKRSARLVPAEGGMMVELLGSSTFVPIAFGTLEKELTVDAHLLAGFLRNSTRAFHPAEIVGLNIDSNQLAGTCGTLKVTLQLRASSSGQRQGSGSLLAQSTSDRRLPEPISESARAGGREPLSRQTVRSPPSDDDISKNIASASGQVEPVSRLSDAEARPNARNANAIRTAEPEEPAQAAPVEKAPSRWRRNLIIGVSALMFFVALYDRRVQRAYDKDVETFLGMVIFMPVLAGLFTTFLILVFDFARNRREQSDAIKWVAQDPARAVKETVRLSAHLLFLGCIFLSFFGFEWLLKTWTFWSAAGVALIMVFVG